MSSFPADWTSTNLGEVAKEMLGGGTPSTKNPSFWQGNIPWLTSKSLGDSIYLTAGEKTISEEAVRKSATHIVPAGNLIFATRVGVGKVVVTKIDVAISQDSTGIVVDPTEVDPTFLAYQLRTDSVQRFVEQNKRGATIQGITRTSLQQVDVVIPPLPEQRRIAHVLATVHTAIKQQARMIALTRELKSTLMRKLFTAGLHGEKQKETEIGLVPESWEVGTLDDIKSKEKGAIVSGPFGSNIGKRFFVESGVPLIRGGNLTKGEEFLVEEGFVFITEEKAQELKSCIAITGDLIFTAAGTLGQIGVIPEKSRYPKYVISNKQLRARIDQTKASPLFLFYWFSTAKMRKLIEQRRSGSSIPVINLSILRSLPIPIPSLEEEHEIAKKIQIAAQKIALIKQKTQLLEEVFRTLLQQLMTGQTRVNEIDLPGLS